MAILFPSPVFKYWKDDGTLAGGYLLNFYETGTATRKDTYTDATEGTANANPVVLDSEGEAIVYLNGTYKLVITDADGVVDRTIDPYASVTAVSGSTTIAVAKVAHGFVVGNVLYHNGTNWAKAVATATSTLSNPPSIVTSSADADNFVIMNAGEITLTTGEWDTVTGGSGGLTAGSIYYLDTTAGKLTTTEPDFSNPILMATSTTTAAVLPYRPSGGSATTAALGSFVRPLFTRNSSTNIGINAGAYEVAGFWRSWVSGLTFVTGSGGSNANSTDLGASERHYLYIDKSVMGSNTTLTAAMFINTTTAPTWSNPLGGWYTGSDRCIFSFTTDGSSNIVEFFHDGGDYVPYADQIEDLTATDIDTTWTDVTLSIPVFATKANVTFEVLSGAASMKAKWRTNGQTGTTGHVAVSVLAVSRPGAAQADVITDSSQVIEVVSSVSDDGTIAALLNGWYFGRGM